MSEEYKDITKAKRSEAQKLMTKQQLTKCHIAIHTATIASSASAAIPIPVADAIPISAAQITMVVALGKIFEKKISQTAAKALLSAAASTFVGRELVKLIPVVGWVVSAAVAGGITEALGWSIAVDLAKEYIEKSNKKQTEQEAAQYYADMKYYKALTEDDYSEEAEDLTSSDSEKDS